MARIAGWRGGRGARVRATSVGAAVAALAMGGCASFGSRAAPPEMVGEVATSGQAAVPGAAPAKAPAGSDSAVSAADTVMANRVRREFLHAWDGYRHYAWGHDELKPLSKTWRDWYATSLLMTPVDAYDTMLLMGLDSVAADTKRLIVDSLSFDVDDDVQVFEVTIRLVGGLLTAYEMDGDRRFLALAEDLGERLLPAFDTPTGMPYRFVNLRTGAVRDSASNPAEIGTLMLEFGRLSEATGRPEFRDAAKKAITAVFERRSSIGLVGEQIDVRTGEWLNRDSHVSGAIDSYYEYLLKSWLLFGDADFKTMWDASIGPVNAYLSDTRFGGLWYGHVDMNTGRRTHRWFGALDAFFPAVLDLGGDAGRAERLMDSVYRMWTFFDVEPEVMDYGDMAAVYAAYPLRPEALESAYYLWTTTHDPKYRVMGKDMFERIVRYGRTDVGYASIADVGTKEQRDAMPSFLLAETFKYAYLLFAGDAALDFDSVIFNTEAHPLKRGR